MQKGETPIMNVVTGAFGYIGRHIARHLLELGESVKTITTHPDKPNPFGVAMEALPYNFDRPDELRANLRGSTTLYNTYWVRFEYGRTTFDLRLYLTLASPRSVRHQRCENCWLLVVK
jgi:hypothetical protein